MERSGIGIASIWPVLWSNLWDAKVFADLACQLIFDFGMPGHGRAQVAGRVAPP